MRDRQVGLLIGLWMLIFLLRQGTASEDFTTATLVMGAVGAILSRQWLLLPLTLLLPRFLLMVCNWPALLPGASMYAPVAAAELAVVLAAGRARVSSRLAVGLAAFLAVVSGSAWQAARELGQDANPLVVLGLSAAVLGCGVWLGRRE